MDITKAGGGALQQAATAGATSLQGLAGPSRTPVMAISFQVIRLPPKTGCDGCPHDHVSEL
jgi:hypothetical protein